MDANEGIYTEAFTKNAEAYKAQTDAYSKIAEAVAKANGEFEGLNLTVYDVVNGLNTSNEANKLWIDTNAETAKSILALKDEYKSAGDTVGTTSTDISDYEAAMAASIEGDYDKVKDILSGGNDAFQNAADVAGQTTDQIRQQAGQNYVDAVNEIAVALDNYQKNQNSVNENVLNEAINHASDMRREYTKVGGNIVDGEVEGFNGNKYKINGAIDASVAEVGAYKDQYKSKGEDAGQGYADGIASKLTAVKTAIGSLVQKGIDFLAFTQKSSSPAKETEWKGEDFGDGYAIGIASKEGVVKESAKKLALAAIDSLDSSFDDGRTEAQKVADKYANTPLTLNEMIKFEKPDYGVLSLAEQRYVDDIIAYNKTQRSVDRQDEANKLKESLDEKLANAKTEAETEKAWAEWEKSEKDRIRKDEKEDAKRDREYYEYQLKKSAERSRDTFEAMQKDIANNEEKILKTFTEMAERSFEVMEDADKARQELVDHLKEYSADLFETKTGTSALGKSYDIMVLTNFDKKNKELERFRDNLLELQQNSDMPPEFFNIVKKLPVNDAIKFTNKLLNLNDDKFKEYIDSWKENQALTESIGTEVSADTTMQTLNGIGDAFTDFSEDLETLGETNASAYGKGFLAEIKEQIPTILGALNTAFGNIIGVPSYALATSSDAGSTSNSNINNNPITVLGKLEIDGREYGKFTFDQMEIEGRRRGTK